MEAQKLLPTIQNKRGISFAGAWTKYGASGRSDLLTRLVLVDSARLVSHLALSHVLGSMYVEEVFGAALGYVEHDERSLVFHE